MLAVEQATDVAQHFVGADLAVAVLGHQAVDDVVDLRSCSPSGVRVDVVIFTTSRRSANSFFSIASFSRSWLR